MALTHHCQFPRVCARKQWRCEILSDLISHPNEKGPFHFIAPNICGFKIISYLAAACPEKATEENNIEKEEIIKK